MGDAEFEGGGSVKWQINHSEGDFCDGHKHGGKGRDKNPKGPNGLFIVTVTGQKPIIVPTKGTTVRVVWGDPSDSQVVLATAKPKTARSTAAKSKTVRRKTSKTKTASA